MIWQGLASSGITTLYVKHDDTVSETKGQSRYASGRCTAEYPGDKETALARGAAARPAAAPAHTCGSGRGEDVAFYPREHIAGIQLVPDGWLRLMVLWFTATQERAEHGHRRIATGFHASADRG